MKLEYPSSIETVDMSPERRQEFVDQLGKQVWDLCVIGGGITGVGVAWHAALAGLRVALVEKADFAAGTSSKSSKLIHGGFRYLQNYQFKLVHEALTERFLLLHLCPHLVTRLPSIFPIFKGAKFGWWQIKAGMLLYEWLSGCKRIGHHHMMKPAEVLHRVPFFREELLKGGAYYFDAKADDFRLLLAVLQNAVLKGCVAANYVEVVGGEVVSGRLQALHAVDKLSGEQLEIRAKVFVNASGPWTDQVIGRIDAGGKPLLRPTMGVHVLIPREVLPLNEALMILSVVDQRPIFAVPWNNVVLLGTTDTDFDGDPDLLWATREDVNYVLESFNGYFRDLKIKEEDVISSFAGLRPLIRVEKTETGKIPREHQVKEFPGNLFNLYGGKLTTFRRMASDLMAIIHEKRPDLAIPRSVPTDSVPLYGSEMPEFSLRKGELSEQIMQKFGLEADICAGLLEFYGCHAEDVVAGLASDPSLKERIIGGLPYIWAQLDYAIDHEMTVSLDDFLIRRTHVLSLDWDQGRSVCREVAQRMAKRLGWKNDEIERQVQRYLAKVSLTRRFREYQSEGRT